MRTHWGKQKSDAPKHTATGRMARDTPVDYMAQYGRAVATFITIPKGAAVVQVDGGDWAVADIALLIKLTGNTHDPKYRYCWVPADAVEPGETKDLRNGSRVG